MAKQHKGGRVLEQTHDEDTGEALGNIPAPAQDEAEQASEQAATQAESPAAIVPAVGDGKKKKNTQVQILYLGDMDNEGKRKEFGSPNPQVRALKVITRAGEQVIELTSIKQEVLMTAAVFGFNTAWRNAHNSNENAGKDGIAAMNARIAANLAGSWSAETEAGEQGTPLVIEAMIHAKKAGGAYTEGMEKRWLDHYYALDGKGRQAQTAEWLKNGRIKASYLIIKAERAAEAARAASAKLGEEAAVGGDF